MVEAEAADQMSSKLFIAFAFQITTLDFELFALREYITRYESRIPVSKRQQIKSKKPVVDWLRKDAVLIFLLLLGFTWIKFTILKV